MRACLVLLAALALLLSSVLGYENRYEYDRGGLHEDDALCDHPDDYGDDGDMYHEGSPPGSADTCRLEHGHHAGDNDYYDHVATVKACTIDKDGKVKLADGTAPCDIKVEGVDKQADLLSGGLVGVYKPFACHNGRPLYNRHKSPAGEDRVLYYSKPFADWDVSKGVQPNEKEVLLYGGELKYCSMPLFAKTWRLGAGLTTAGAELGDDQFLSITATMKCADGEVYQPPVVISAVQKQGPIPTDEAIEAEYKHSLGRKGLV